MRFTIHTGLKRTPFEQHHGRKPRTQLTNTNKNRLTFSSDWFEMSISAPNKPILPIYVGHDANGEITNHMNMARTKLEEKQLNEGPKSLKKKTSVKYPFTFVWKNHKNNSLEGQFQQKIQTAVDGTRNNVKTDPGEIKHQKFISRLLFQTGKQEVEKGRS